MPWKTIGFKHESSMSSAINLRTFSGSVSNVTVSSSVVTVEATGHGMPLDGTITSASASSPVSMVTITFASHGLSNGEEITIESAAGHTGLNNTWKVTNVATNTFQLIGSEGVAPRAAYTSGGTWRRARRAVIASVGGATEANGTWPIRVTGANTFVLVGLTAITAYTSGGTYRSIAPGTQRVLMQAVDQDVHWRGDGTTPTSSDGGGNVLVAGQDPVAYMGPFDSMQFIDGPTASAKLNLTFQKLMGHP